MLLKLLGALIITLGTWVLGKNVQENFNEQIKIIDSYIFFLQGFKSNVSFSCANMYSFFEKNKEQYTQSLLDYLIKKQDISSISDYKSQSEVERKCIYFISDCLIIAEKSSDTEFISNCFEEGILRLIQYKKDFLEENRGKIKAAPALGVVVGIFVSILLV